MRKIGKKAGLISGLIKLVILIIVITLLVFLIKNDWNVGFAINEFIEFIGKLKGKASS